MLVFPGGTSGKELSCQCRRHKRHGFDPWVRKICWRRYRLPSPVFLGFPGKESACKVRDLDLIPGLKRSPREGKGYPLQYSGLENPMERGAWRAMVCGWQGRGGHPYPCRYAASLTSRLNHHAILTVPLQLTTRFHHHCIVITQFIFHTCLMPCQKKIKLQRLLFFEGPRHSFILLGVQVRG